MAGPPGPPVWTPMGVHAVVQPITPVAVIVPMPTSATLLHAPTTAVHYQRAIVPVAMTTAVSVPVTHWVGPVVHPVVSLPGNAVLLRTADPRPLPRAASSRVRVVTAW